MYQALYRKYRPQRFEDVVGQRHIIQTLKNAIDQNRIGHAYLFSEDYDNAIDSYEKYMDDRNFHNEQIYSNIWNNYGVALANLGRTEEARNAYANAVRIDPDNEIARDNLNNIGYSRRGSNNGGIVSGISSTIDAVNEVYKKVDPEVVKGVVDIVKYFLKWEKEYFKGL